MAKLAVGDSLPAREFMGIRGERVGIPDPGRLVHLQFRRYAGCPVCHLHLRSVSARLDEIVAAGIREVVVFHSSVDALLEHQAALPFATIADPGRKLYAEFGVEVAPKAVLHPRTWAAAARGVLKQRRPRAALGVGESHLGLPGDFLIAPDGRLLAVKYGTHADDQWSVDELLAHAAAAEPGARPTPVHRSTGRR